MAVIRNTPSKPGNDGERKMLDLLKTLPDDYTILCELALDVAGEGMPYQERRPDFVVLGPGIGVLGIEVKDWNIERNSYEFIDQTKVRQTTSGEEIKNPWNQAQGYKHGLERLLRGTNVWTSCFVAFPKLKRATFKNSVATSAPDRSNIRAVWDESSTIFADDVDGEPNGLAGLLRQRVASRKPADRSAGSEKALAEAEEKLLPSHLIVGTAGAGRVEARKQIKLLSERQRAEVEALDESPRFLLDLAGSGKTNVLASRALFLADRAERRGQPLRILLLTYSDKLADNIKLMLERKRQGREAVGAIEVMSIEDLQNALIRAAYGDSGSAGSPLVDSSLPLQTRVAQLQEWIESIGAADQKRFRIYDAVLVDEIQDLGSIADTINDLVNKGREYFRVGDVAQRIFSANLVIPATNRDQVSADYVMYRCPKPVATFADRFARMHPLLIEELARYGYQSPQFQGPAHGHPELETVLSSSQELFRIVQIIREEQQRIPLNEILVVTSKSGIPDILSKLQAENIAVTDHPTNANAVLVVDFPGAKGLERETVIVSRIEDLPVEAPGGPFARESDNLQADALAMREVYVAITRCHHRLVLLIRDELHPIVKRLREAQSQ